MMCDFASETVVQSTPPLTLSAKRRGELTRELQDWAASHGAEAGDLKNFTTRLVRMDDGELEALHRERLGPKGS